MTPLTRAVGASGYARRRTPDESPHVDATLATIHQILGYLVFAIVLAVGFYGLSRAKSGFEFNAQPFSLSVVLLDVQVALGLVLWLVQSRWDFANATFSYIHPLIMIGGLAVAHIGLGRARRERMAVSAWRLAARMLLVAAVIIAVGIGVASMP